MSVWDTVGAAIANEFSDIGDAEQLTQLVLRTVMAALLGGVIGLEREVRGKAAGIRTHMLMAVGSALLMIVPAQLGYDAEAMSRIIQGLLAGIGLLCAGSILKQHDDDRIFGLTTAAGLWMTAAVGIAVGLGREATAAVSTLVALVILSLEGPLRRLKKKHEPGEQG